MTVINIIVWRWCR